MRAQDHFFRLMLQPSLPLLIWGVHFFFCYFFAAEQDRFGQPALAWILALASLLALAILALLCWRALRRVHGGESISLLDWATAACALLAAVGVLLTCLPMLLLG